MIDKQPLVDDALLRELSAETRKIGTKITIKEKHDQPRFTADIINVIVMPQAEFYRTKFMLFYKSCNQNAVKALKELNINFPYAPDYNLGIAYVLNINTKEENFRDLNTIVIKNEFELPEINSAEKKSNHTTVKKDTTY